MAESEITAEEVLAIMAHVASQEPDGRVGFPDGLEHFAQEFLSHGLIERCEEWFTMTDKGRDLAALADMSRLVYAGFRQVH